MKRVLILSFLILISGLIAFALLQDQQATAGDYYFWFIEKVREGDRGQWLDSAGMNATLLENFNYIHNLPYKKDEELYHCSEYYARASEFYTIKAGDCEDKAIAFASAAYHLGTPYNASNYVRVVLGNVNSNYTKVSQAKKNETSSANWLFIYGIGHAWVEIGDIEVMVYDPTAGIILNRTAYYNYYVPIEYPWISEPFWFSWHQSSGLEFYPVFCYF